MRGTRAVELVGLPFDETEQSWFEEYLLEGKGKALYGAKDSVVMRLISLGQTEQAAKLSDQIKERRIDGVNWQTLVDGLQ